MRFIEPTSTTSRESPVRVKDQTFWWTPPGASWMKESARRSSPSASRSRAGAFQSRETASYTITWTSTPRSCARASSSATGT